MSLPHFSEALIITKCRNLREIQDWLFWYVKVLGFDVISLYDNESPVDVKSECDKYPNVYYHWHPGFADQVNTYETHVNHNRKATWVFPVDDDEFLYLSDKYNHSVNTFLHAMEDTFSPIYNRPIGKISVQWVNLIPREYMEYRDRESSLLHSHVCISDKAMDNIYPWKGRWMVGYLKTFVHSAFQWSYDCLPGIKRKLYMHNPYSPEYHYGSILERGKCVAGGVVFFKFNPNAFLAHYSLRSDKEWYEKCHRPTVSCQTATMASSERLFKRIYEYTEDFIPCTLVRDLYNEKRKEFGMD